jgi:hypothetical protein
VFAQNGETLLDEFTVASAGCPCALALLVPLTQAQAANAHRIEMNVAALGFSAHSCGLTTTDLNRP